MSWSEERVDRELLGAIQKVTKAAGCTNVRGSIEYVTPPERAEALAKAADYDQAAGRMANQAEAAAYRELAATERQKAGVA